MKIKKEPIKKEFDLMLENPKFNKFVKENEKKTIEEISLEYDIDLNILLNLL